MDVELKLYNAVVVDNDDENKKGKIKIRVLPQMERCEVEDLPWAIPFSSFNSSKCVEFAPLEINSVVRVLIDEYWKRFYYLQNEYFERLFDYNKVNSVLSKVDVVDKTYKNLQFKLYEDGVLEFHNIKEGSFGVVHPSGSFSVFDKNGNIKINVAFGNKIYVGNGTNSLGKIIDDVINNVRNARIIGSTMGTTSLLVNGTLDPATIISLTSLSESLKTFIEV